MARRLLNALFPWSCVACRKHSPGPLCDDCLGLVRWASGAACPRCGLPLGAPPAHLCGRCSIHPPAFERAAVLAAYESRGQSIDPLALWLQGLKYGRRRVLAAPLARLLAERFPFDPREIDVVVPVPLHRERLRSRGFNQSLLLARGPAKRFRLPIASRALVRVRQTASQVGLGVTQRARNLRGAFAVRDPGAVCDRRVLLVDDVCTTTETADACARALLGAGARSVSLLAVARTVIR